MREIGLKKMKTSLSSGVMVPSFLPYGGTADSRWSPFRPVEDTPRAHGVEDAPLEGAIDPRRDVRLARPKKTGVYVGVVGSEEAVPFAVERYPTRRVPTPPNW